MRDEDLALALTYRLRERLHAAERVCVLFGWTAQNTSDSEREDALTQAWLDWSHVVPDGFMQEQPDLSDEAIHELAEKRRHIRKQTLAAIQGVGSSIDYKGEVRNR